MEKADRLAWYNKEVFPKFGVTTQVGMVFQPLSWLSDAFGVEFASSTLMHSAIDTLRAATLTFVDEEAGNSQHQLLIRRSRTLQQRKQGKYNSHFYKAVMGIIPHEPSLAGFTPKPVGGVLYLKKDSWYAPLIKFKKMGESSWEPELVEATVVKYGLDKVRLTAAIQVASQAAADE